MRGREGWGQRRGYWSTVDEARGRGVRGRRRERGRARCYPALPDVLHTTWPHLAHSRQLSRNIQAQHTQREQDDRCASITPDLVLPRMLSAYLSVSRPPRSSLRPCVCALLVLRKQRPLSKEAAKSGRRDQLSLIGPSANTMRERTRTTPRSSISGCPTPGTPATAARRTPVRTRQVSLSQCTQDRHTDEPCRPPRPASEEDNA